MATLTHEVQQPVSVSADKLFKVFVLELENMPKILGQTMQGVQTFQGNEIAPGTIKKYTYAEGGQAKSVKHKVDVLDKNNFTFAYTTVESDSWDVDGLEKASFESKFVPSPDGGSIYKNKIKYYAKAGNQLDQEQIKAFEEKMVGIVKRVESYILANPNV